MVVFCCEKPTNYCVQLSLFVFHYASFCENPKIRISTSPPEKVQEFQGSRAFSLFSTLIFSRRNAAGSHEPAVNSCYGFHSLRFPLHGLAYSSASASPPCAAAEPHDSGRPKYYVNMCVISVHHLIWLITKRRMRQNVSLIYRSCF